MSCPDCGGKGWEIFNEGQPFAPLGEVQACDCGILEDDDAAREAAALAGFVVGEAYAVLAVPSSRTVGPFPAEPVLGSPEAGAQAAKTIFRDIDVCDRCGGRVGTGRETPAGFVSLRNLTLPWRVPGYRHHPSLCEGCFAGVWQALQRPTPEPAPATCSAGDRETCKGGAWGTPDACLLHEGLPIAADGLCIEGRGGKAYRPATLATASPWRVEDAVHAFAHLERAQKDCAFANLLGALSVRLRYSEKPVCLQDLVEAALRAGAEVTP